MCRDLIFLLCVEEDRIFKLASPASAVHYQYGLIRTPGTGGHDAIAVPGRAKPVRVHPRRLSARDHRYLQEAPACLYFT